MFLTNGSIIFLSPIGGGSGGTNNPSGIQYFDAFYRDTDGVMDSLVPVGFYAESVGDNNHDE